MSGNSVQTEAANKMYCYVCDLLGFKELLLICHRRCKLTELTSGSNWLKKVLNAFVCPSFIWFLTQYLRAEKILRRDWKG